MKSLIASNPHSRPDPDRVSNRHHIQVNSTRRVPHHWFYLGSINFFPIDTVSAATYVSCTIAAVEVRVLATSVAARTYTVIATPTDIDSMQATAAPVRAVDVAPASEPAAATARFARGATVVLDSSAAAEC